MFKSTHSLLILGLISLATAQNTTTQKIGWSGTLSSLDGGLGGVVTVTNPTTLTISSYTLKDASAPALYWWGTTDGILKDGFRISNTHITQAATSDMLTINLDAGKTTADFNTAGLWCEQLNANFGQATLTVGGASSASPSMSSTGTTPALSMSSTGSAPAASSSKAGAASAGTSYGLLAATFMAATVFAAWIV